MSVFAPLQVKVWGEYALFTQPEMKVERFSYPVMSPSAARGILESIFWKPEFQWIVKEIHVMKPIRYQSILRNEVSKVIPERTMIGKQRSDYYVDDDRQQRNSLVLRDVMYKIVADIELTERATENIAKYRDIFRRRVKKGQCFQRPYLGCREFAAFFAEVEPDELTLPLDYDIGTMLFDLQYPTSPEKSAVPVFFDAYVKQGILQVPSDLYRAVRKCAT